MHFNNNSYYMSHVVLGGLWNPQAAQFSRQTSIQSPILYFLNQYMASTMVCFVQVRVPNNPSSPSIKMYILVTFVRIFVMVLVGRIYTVVKCQEVFVFGHYFFIFVI